MYLQVKQAFDCFSAQGIKWHSYNIEVQTTYSRQQTEKIRCWVKLATNSAVRKIFPHINYRKIRVYLQHNCVLVLHFLTFDLLWESHATKFRAAYITYHLSDAQNIFIRHVTAFTYSTFPKRVLLWEQIFLRGTIPFFPLNASSHVYPTLIKSYIHSIMKRKVDCIHFIFLWWSADHMLAVFWW